MQKLLSGQTDENHFVLCSFPQPRVGEHRGRGMERLLKQKDGWECLEMLSLRHSMATAFMGCIYEHLYESKPTKSATFQQASLLDLGSTHKWKRTWTWRWHVGGAWGLCEEELRMRTSKADCFRVWSCQRINKSLLERESKKWRKA